MIVIRLQPRHGEGKCWKLLEAYEVNEFFNWSWYSTSAISVGRGNVSEWFTFPMPLRGRKPPVPKLEVEETDYSDVESWWTSAWSEEELNEFVLKHDDWPFEKIPSLINSLTNGAKRCSRCHDLKNLPSADEITSCSKSTTAACKSFTSCPTSFADGKQSSSGPYWY